MQLLGTAGGESPSLLVCLATSEIVPESKKLAGWRGAGSTYLHFFYSLLLLTFLHFLHSTYFYCPLSTSFPPSTFYFLLFLFSTSSVYPLRVFFVFFFSSVRDTHGGGWSRKINARYLHTLMVYL